MSMEAATPNSKVDYISTRIDKSIDTFDKSAAWYRRIYFNTSISTLLLSATITVIAGWKQVPFATENPILVLSALSTVVSGWGLFFSPRNSWLICASSLNRLRRLRGRIAFMMAPPTSQQIDEKTASELYSELQKIFDDHNTAWLELRSKSVPAAHVVTNKATSQ
jgi:hypothetical protein